MTPGSVRVVQLIEVVIQTQAAEGTKSATVQFWTLDGQLVFEREVTPQPEVTDAS